MIVSDALQSYIDKHAHSLDAHLDQIERNTYLHTLQPHMLSGKHQAVFLKLLALTSGAKNILEIGTFTGYTALTFAEAVPENGSVVTIECDAEMADRAQSNFNQSTYGHKVKLIVGEAKLLLTNLLKHYSPDLVFIDADKESNSFYYHLCMEYLPSGAIILIDNVLWKGKVLDSTIIDKKTNSIRAFNEEISLDARADACLLPMRDGIYYIRKK